MLDIKEVEAIQKAFRLVSRELDWYRHQGAIAETDNYYNLLLTTADNLYCITKSEYGFKTS